jgi:hypothetical protein
MLGVRMNHVKFDGGALRVTGDLGRSAFGSRKLKNEKRGLALMVLRNDLDDVKSKPAPSET